MKKNRLEKVRKHVFYKHTNIVTKKWREKTREKIFSKKHTNIASKKDGKNRLEKVPKQVFFINIRIS